MYTRERERERERERKKRRKVECYPSPRESYAALQMNE
jgi:hypothetical protein